MKRLFKEYWEYVVVSFITASIFGIVTYATLIILQPVSADPVLFLDYWKNGAWQLFSQGRWASNFFFSLRGYLVVPALSCFILIVDSAICASLMVHIFGVKRRFLAGLIGILIVVHPYIANAQMYYVSSGVFIFSLVMFTLWVTYCINYDFRWKLLINALLLTFSIAYSQSVISLFTCVTALKLFFDLLTGEKNNRWKNFFLNLSSAAISCILYIVVWKVLCIVTNTNTFYGGAASYGLSNTIASLPQSIKKIYNIFYSFYFNDSILFNTYWNRQMLNILLFISALIMIVYLAYTNYKSGKINLLEILMMIFVLLFVPFAVAPFVLIVTDYSFYLMTASGFLPILPFIAIIIDQIKINVPIINGARILSATMIICIIWTYIWTDNAGFLLLNNTFKQTKELASRILIRIEDLEGFSYDMPVCFIGQPSDEAYAMDINLFNASPGSTFSQEGVFPGIWENSDGWGLYIYHYTGVKLNYLTNGMQQRIKELSETVEFKNTKCFPAEDSVRIIDGTVVVKLGEVDYSE